MCSVESCKSFIPVVSLSEINCHEYWFGSMWEIFKMDIQAVHSLKSYQNLVLQNWIWKLVLEIMQNEVYKV